MLTYEFKKKYPDEIDQGFLFYKNHIIIVSSTRTEEEVFIVNLGTKEDDLNIGDVVCFYDSYDQDELIEAAKNYIDKRDIISI